jgi:hypothetical protein
MENGIARDSSAMAAPPTKRAVLAAFRVGVGVRVRVRP